MAAYEVTARNRETNAVGDDAVLSALDTTDFDELWLFATDAGCPSFVDEPPGHGMKRDPRALADIYAYVRDAASRLAGEKSI